VKILAVDGVPVPIQREEPKSVSTSKKVRILQAAEEMPGDGGNCGECGDNLCAECAGKWSEYGECDRCSKEAEL
jgi:hypothetical protein